MHQQISKKLLLYFFLLIIFGTINNKNLILFEFFKIKEINIVDIDFKDNQNFLSNLNLFKKQNILFLSEIDIKKKISENELIENFSIFKKYPSTLLINIKKTNFLAYLKKDNELFLIGSNGRLIKTKDKIKDLPHIFGNFENKDFFKLKNIIDKSDLDFEKIDNLYFFPSGRWDIETNFGIMIKLPSENLKESLELSLEIIKDKKFDNIKIIDLRQNNQVIVDG
jgi:cell division protein FtsQ